MIEQTTYNKFGWNFRAVVCLGCSIIILLVLIFNGTWIDPLYKQGVNMINSSQKMFQGQFYVVVNNLFSMLCHPTFVGILLLLEIALVKHKLKALIHIAFFLLCIYFIAVFKQIYQQSRPIWSSNLIKKLQWFCPTDFGNPSGHSFAVFPLYQPLIAKYLGFQHYKTAWIFLIIFGFFVPFSRTYLGVHSVNQVMFGLTLGVAATVIYRYGLRQYSYKIFSKIYKLKKIKYLIFMIIAHIVLFLIPYIFFQIYSQNRPIQKKDIDNLNGFCFSELTSLLIQQSMLVKCTFQSFVFGILYGLYFLKVSNKGKKYFAGRWNYPKYQSAVYHLLATVAVTVPILLVFNVLIPKFVQVTFLDYFSHTIGMILTGFSLAYFLPKVQEKFKLIQFEQSLLYTQKPQYEMLEANKYPNRRY